MVVKENIYASKAAHNLKIKLSTAKNIIKLYKNEGRVMDKCMSKKKASSTKKISEI